MKSLAGHNPNCRRLWVSFIAESQIARNPRKDVRYLPIEQCEAAFYTSALYRAGGLRPEDRRFFEAERELLGTTSDKDALAATDRGCLTACRFISGGSGCYLTCHNVVIMMGFNMHGLG